MLTCGFVSEIKDNARGYLLTAPKDSRHISRVFKIEFKNLSFFFFFFAVLMAHIRSWTRDPIPSQE